MENILKPPFTKKSNELIIILVLGFIFTVAASSYNLFESIVIFIESCDSEGLGLMLVLSVYVSFGMGIFSLRRWTELENTLVLYREAECDLEEKDRMYRTLFEQSSDAVIISDGKKVLDINKKGCEIFGFGQKRPFNVSLMSFIQAEYLPELQQAFKETFRQGSSNFEMRYQKPEGEIVDIKVNLSLIDRKDNIVQLVAQDITFSKNIERSEQENRERLKAILDNTLCGILLIESSSRKIINANPIALKTAGYSEKELIGMTCYRLIGQHGEENCAALSLDQAGDLSESILLTATGKTLPILRSVVPVSIGGTGYFVESFIDLSDRKQVEEELLQAKIAAESANRSMSEFLATMSHELRTPLTAIIGFSELMLGGSTGEFDELNKKFLGNISTSGKHLLSLINSILDLSKIEAGKMELQPDYFSLQDIFSNTKNILSPLALKKNISMDFNVEPGFFVYADRTRFKQIMYNLVSNAVKFTQEGGSVEVLGTVSEKGVRVSVSDTGIGISKDEIKQLFKPFKQIDSTLSRKYEGTGLGLVLSKKFIEMHGGRIWVESEPGKGSTFTFEVPVKTLKSGEIFRAHETAEKAHKTAETGEVNAIEGPVITGKAIESGKPVEPIVLNELTESGAEIPVKIPKMEDITIGFKSCGSDVSAPLVMVVEDDRLSRELLFFTLKEAGYRVVQAATGEEALSLAQKLKPFVITLDLMLPEMNGWDVLENLKKDSVTSGIPVLVLSITEKNDCKMLWGAFDHLVKPVDKSVLLSSLDRLKTNLKKDSPKILIADDQESMLELMSSMIEFEGYVISLAQGGKEAIDKASTEIPDAIILDLNMPDVSGFEVIKALKKNPQTVDIPVIVCTSKDLSMQEMKMLNSSVSFVMQKEDLNKRKLLELIRRLEPENCGIFTSPAYQEVFQSDSFRTEG
ncbi:ATPase [Methanosarcina mazei]|uniref:histidine kinase n=1 Tax=Methanosarcina mazei TaxID=2209 RepID=A0A0F8MNY9_METMZ|nr:response regulator [Methanosarcina mazei]KKF99963.1 ATPase [Methanosarcina mazei]KKG04197.1 ATPase [Methanosarcina mazei]KKH40378.1 ATPase [Methanosarcina mazei]KKH42747.1 ATPase [Methanosarcina mazei]KKH45634.1 ATPase [Methanosarcina mazei]